MGSPRAVQTRLRASPSSTTASESGVGDTETISAARCTVSVAVAVAVPATLVAVHRYSPDSDPVSRFHLGRTQDDHLEQKFDLYTTSSSFLPDKSPRYDLRVRRHLPPTSAGPLHSRGGDSRHQSAWFFLLAINNKKKEKN